MKGTTHIVTGIGFSLVLETYLPCQFMANMILGVFLGSLMPDIDADGLIAKPGKLLGVKAKNLREFFNLMGHLVSKVIQSFTKHRGFFHWPIIGMILTLLGYFIDSTFLFYFGIGYFIHCILDMFNGEGVPVFAPLSLKKRSIADIKYGGIGETLYLIIFACIVIFFLKDDIKKDLLEIKYKDRNPYSDIQY